MPRLEIVLPGEPVTCSPLASGFAHGFGLFETVRLREGRIELWDAHWRRLVASAGELGIACPFESEEALDAAKVLGQALSGEGILKLSLLREGDSSKLFLYSRPGNELPECIGLLLASSVRIDEDSPLSGHKTHNYMENMLALQAAQDAGCFDGLRCNSKGQVAEGAISNLFFHREGGWHTPSLGCGVLPGVIRGLLTENLPVTQGTYRLDDILAAEAVFLTNASIGLQAVDWLSKGGERLPLPSREHQCYQPARSLLENLIQSRSVQVP